MKSFFPFFLVLITSLFVACDLLSPPEDQGEEEWELLDSAKQTYVFASQEVPAIFYGGDGNKNYRSFDGETWEPFSTGLGVGTKVIAYSERVLYAICYTDPTSLRPNIFAMSKDNGETWEAINQTLAYGYRLKIPRCLCLNRFPNRYPPDRIFLFLHESPHGGLWNLLSTT